MRHFVTAILIILCATISMAQSDEKQPFWSDTHGIINKEKAMLMNLEDHHDFIAAAVKDYDGLIKSGVILGTKANALAIRNHVDFCDYLVGYWDTDYSDIRPGSDKAIREIDADKQIDVLWSSAISSMKMHKELSANPNYDRTSGIDMLNEIATSMSDYVLIHDCSPSVRLQMTERWSVLRQFIKANKV